MQIRILHLTFSFLPYASSSTQLHSTSQTSSRVQRYSFLAKKRAFGFPKMALELAPEIYIIIASFISSPSTLSSCCRVSKPFKKLFTPCLYGNICISHRRILPENVYESTNLLASTVRLEAKVSRRNEESVANPSDLLPNLISLSVQ
jgi:hypothetical protein